MTALVLVAMAITDPNDRESLQRQADEQAATLAFMQGGEPSLVTELDRLAASGASHVTLRGVSLGTRLPARSWLRRVTGHWVRAGIDRPVVLVDSGPVTGDEAPLNSSAWEEVPSHRHHVVVCRGPRCSAQGADGTADALDASLRFAGLGDDDVLVAQTGCLYPCNHAPVVVVHPDDVWCGQMDQTVVQELVETHLVGGVPLARLRLPRPVSSPDQGAESSTQSPQTPAPGTR